MRRSVSATSIHRLSSSGEDGEWLAHCADSFWQNRKLKDSSLRWPPEREDEVEPGDPHCSMDDAQQRNPNVSVVVGSGTLVIFPDLLGRLLIAKAA